MFLETIATLAAGLFAGAAIFINLVEHPARMEGGTAAALKEWRPSYKKATLMQAPLAAVGFLSASAAWLMGAEIWWLVGGVLLGSVIPFTLFVITPTTNDKLLDPTVDEDATSTHKLLVNWGRLHAVRSVLSLAAFLIFMLLL